LIGLSNSYGDKYALYSLRYFYAVGRWRVRRSAQYGHFGAGYSKLLREACDADEIGDAVGWVMSLPAQAFVLAASREVSILDEKM
jgi:hypothetical protein